MSLNRLGHIYKLLSTITEEDDTISVEYKSKLLSQFRNFVDMNPETISEESLHQQLENVKQFALQPILKLQWDLTVILMDWVVEKKKEKEKEKEKEGEDSIPPINTWVYSPPEIIDKTLLQPSMPLTRELEKCIKCRLSWAMVSIFDQEEPFHYCRDCFVDERFSSQSRIYRNATSCQLPQCQCSGAFRLETSIFRYIMRDPNSTAVHKRFKVIEVNRGICIKHVGQTLGKHNQYYVSRFVSDESPPMKRLKLMGGEEEEEEE